MLPVNTEFQPVQFIQTSFIEISIEARLGGGGGAMVAAVASILCSAAIWNPDQ
jgi:hypothetical protein